MKNLFFLTTFAAVAIFSLAACDKNGGNGEQPAKSIITVEKSNIGLQGDMSEYSFKYSVTGESEGATVNAVATVDWIEIMKVDASTVTFMVKGIEKLSREGYINLSLEDAKTVSVFITQNTTKRFDISLSDLTTTGVAVAVKPGAKFANKTYYYGIVDKRSYLAAGKEGVITEFIESIKADTSLNIADYIVKGNDSFDFERLWSQTEYYVIVFDLDSDYNYSGEISLFEFTTEATGVSGTDFKFDIDGSKITVTPQSTAKGRYYIMGVMDIYKWSSYPSDTYSGSFYAAFDYLDNITDMQSNLRTGIHTQDYASTLNASEYDIFFAFAFGTNGNGITGINPDIQGDVAFVKFEYNHATDTVKASYLSDSVALQGKILAGRSAK